MLTPNFNIGDLVYVTTIQMDIRAEPYARVVQTRVIALRCYADTYSYELERCDDEVDACYIHATQEAAIKYGLKLLEAEQ